jgi:mannosyltransferase OCH1-like enzyme
MMMPSSLPTRGNRLEKAIKMTLSETSANEHQLVHLTYFTQDEEAVGKAPNEETIREFFPGHSIRMWTIPAVRAELAADGDPRILECFDHLIPFAYKSDLASYYLLKKYGGWYSDLNNFFVASPPDVSECTMYLFRDVHDEPAPWSISTSIFYSRKASPALTKAIELVLKNYRTKTLGNTPLCVTGPTLLGSAVASVGLAPGVNYHTGEFVYQGEQKVFTTREKELFALYKSNGTQHGESGVPGGNNYSELWWKQNVYSATSDNSIIR